MPDNEIITSFLSGLVTERRLGRIEEILAQRTRYMTVVLEDIYQSQNASAVLRTCECFGVQDVHIIENFNSFSINPMVLKGSDQWLSIRRNQPSGNASVEALRRLKSEGYRIIATSLQDESVALSDFDVERGKFAVVFGNEHQGVSDDVMSEADECLKIAMCGFTQSLNISVSAGITIAHLTAIIRNSAIEWRLTPSEKDILRLEWLKNSVKNPEMLIQHLIRGNCP